LARAVELFVYFYNERQLRKKRHISGIFSPKPASAYLDTPHEKVVSESERISYGSILAKYNFGAKPTSPADGTTYTRNAPLIFRWDVAKGCRNSSGLRYSIKVIDEASGRIRWQSDWQTATTLTTTANNRRDIFTDSTGRLIWTVLTRDQNSPPTGDYYGEGRTLIDAYEPQ